MNGSSAFTHLHVHSHYTLLGGTASVADLAARAAAEGLSHLALTDTNALYGAVSFDQACRAVGIQPILGLAVTIAPPEEQLGASATPGLLVLLATGPAGYRSLCRLSSLIQAHPDREALAARGLAWTELEAHSEGLLCLSGGRRGWIERFLRASDAPAVAHYARRLAATFPGSAYLSLELHRPGDLALARKLIELGASHHLPAAAVQPVYTLAPEDMPRLRLLAAINHNLPLDQVPRCARPSELVRPKARSMLH